MALSTAEGKRQRKALLREIAAEHVRQDREKLAELRAKIRDVKTRRASALKLARNQCRIGALKARETAKARVIAIREQAREQVKTARREEVLKARAACDARKTKVATAALSVSAKRRATLQAERDFQREMKRIEHWAKNRKAVKTTALERRQESDDEVRQNITEDLRPLFERVKKGIKGSTRKSRTEAFLGYAEENPHEVVDAMVELSQREIAKLIHQEARLAKAVRRPPPPTAAELAAIPF